ncbi:MAG TPA: hypothetical protein VMM78_10575 [Thermomicrobiales bacterium]|nr:hypothetical protein [Thermomicrobiales bacterium]
MPNLSMTRFRPRTFAVSIAASLLLIVAVACGSNDDTTPPAGATGQTPTAAMTTPADTGTPGADPMGTTPADAVTTELGIVGACLEQNTDADMVEDLRAGQTASAEAVYETCLEDVLPPAVVSELEPVIEQAVACGTTASADLTDDDIAALEAGDREIAESLSIETLNCLSDQLGIPLS